MTQQRHYSDAPQVDFDSAPEMRPYLAQPDAMYVGCPGKHGYLNLGFELDRNGRSFLRELDRRAPLIVQQELYFDEQLPDMPCVYILSSGGPNVDGDRYVQRFTMHRGTMAFISTGAATKLAEMRRNYSGMTQEFTLEEDSYLEYLPEPIIPCRHTRFICDTRITAHPTATLFYSEIYMGGRKYYRDGELFAYDLLSVCSHGERPDGTPLFREKFIIDPARHLAAGITHLPSGAGLLYKVLGMEPGPVKAAVRDFCSKVRLAVKHRPMPDEFPWR